MSDGDEVGPVTRWLAALLSLAVAVLVVDVPMTSGNAALLGVVLAVVLVATALHVCRGRTAGTLVVAVSRPEADERCLRGAFRRQSRPDTPGRPRPRAPGRDPRPAS
ncbi:MAG: DUF6412 domain-containing protein [Streptosporangiaceae bacterium]